MSDRAERFIAFRARSKMLKALSRHVVDCDVVSLDDDSEIEALHEMQTRDDARREANFDYTDCDSLVLVQRVAARDAARFAYLES